MKAAALRRLPVAMACALVAGQARPDIIEWSGQAPVYVAQYFNGSTTEFHEFQFLLDWQGYCNAHPTASCGSATFWGSNGNWLGNAVPSPSDDVRIGAGTVVTIGHYNSVYQGAISGDVQVNYLNSAGTIQIVGSLTVNQADIDTLQLSTTGTLFNNGSVHVGTLAESAGTLSGTGTTFIANVSAGSFNTLVQGGHTLAFTGSYAGNVDLNLYDQSRFTNSGTVNATSRDYVTGAGTFNVSTQSTFVNSGTVNGIFTISGVRFNNDGLVNVDSGYFQALSNGLHSGRFTGGATSQLWFGGLGGVGHRFLAGSSIDSDGQVRFVGCCHSVEGTYRAADTQVGIAGGGFGDVTFKGSVAFMPDVTVYANSNLRFSTANGAGIGNLNLAGAGALAQFGAGGTSQVANLTLTDGIVAANSGLDVTGAFTWNSGTVNGTVDARNGISMGAGSRQLGGLIHNHGTVTWADGNFSSWYGVLDNPVGSTIDLQGDFGVTAGGGRLSNAGLFVKSAGTGTSIMAMALDNTGTVDVQSGVLFMKGGGMQSGLLLARPGTLVELGGDTTVTAAALFNGRFDVLGGNFHVLANAGYVNAAGNHVTYLNDNGFLVPVILNNEGSFTNLSDAKVGALTNTGTFDNSSTLYGASLGNSATFTNTASGQVTTGGGSNAGTLVNQGAFTNLGTFSNTGLIQTTGQFTNAGDLTNSGRIAVSGSFVNSGSLKLTALAELDNAGAFVNSGTLQSDGVITNTASITNAPGATLTLTKALDNRGSIVNQGDFHIEATARVAGPGSYSQTSGTTWVQGRLEVPSGIDIQSGVLKGTGTLVGEVTLGPTAQWRPGNSPGTMTVVGNATVNGDFSLGTAQLEIEIGAASFDQIVVSGVATLNQATIKLVFLPGYTLNDDDLFTSLRASTVVDGGLAYQVSGLPPGWTSSAALFGNELKVELIQEPDYSPALQIASSGTVDVAAGAVAANGAFTSAAVDSLRNAGALFNYAGAALAVSDLNNLASGSISNRGALTVLNTMVNDGVFRNRIGAEFTAYGTVDNSGQWVNTGTATLSAGMTNAAGGQVDNRGLLTLTAGRIVNQGEFIVSGQLANNAYGYPGADGSVQNDGGRFVVATGGSVTGTGTYSQGRVGEFYYFGNDAAGTTQVDGVLAASHILINGGTISGTGTLRGPVAFGGIGGPTVRPGDATGIGTLTIDGDLTATASFEVTLVGDALSGALHVTGSTTLSGSDVVFLLKRGYRPTLGASFAWLQSDGGLVGSANFVGVYTTDDSGAAYQLYTPPDGVQIAFHDGELDFIASVPEPASWVLCLAGLAALWLGRQARRRTATA